MRVLTQGSAVRCHWYTGHTEGPTITGIWPSSRLLGWGKDTQAGKGFCGAQSQCSSREPGPRVLRTWKKQVQRCGPSYLSFTLGTAAPLCQVPGFRRLFRKPLSNQSNQPPTFLGARPPPRPAPQDPAHIPKEGLSAQRRFIAEQFVTN